MRKKLFDLWDISSSYIKYVVFHRWNKLTYRHLRFIEEADWVSGNSVKRKLLDKIKSLNIYPVYSDSELSNDICDKHNVILGKNKYCHKCSEKNNI